MKETLNIQPNLENNKDNRSLYEIIHKTKLYHFECVGKHCQWQFDEKMNALKAGIPEKALTDDRSTRDVVRGILKSKSPVVIEEGDSSKEVGEKANFLKRSGLLDFTFNGCGPNLWAFESEIVVMESTQYPGYMQSLFYPNNELRMKLTEILEPFKDETVQI